MDWDAYLIFKTAGIAVFIFAGGLAAAKQLTISRAKTYFINTLAVFAGLAASSSWYIIQHYFGSEHYIYSNLLQAWGESGAVLYGWVLGGSLAIVLLTRLYKLPTLQYFDAILPWLLVAQVLNRFGCFDAQCCYGRPTDFFISVYNDQAQMRVHPVQLYEAFYDLLLFFFIKTRPHRKGLPTYLYFIGYPSARFFLEFLRGDNQPAALGLTVPQITSLILIAFALTKLRPQVQRLKG